MMYDMKHDVFLTDAEEAPGDIPVRARLKWFNGPKGFGFVNPVDREDIDAFLHITTLQKVGVQVIGDGAEILCQMTYSDKGATVKQVLEVLHPGEISVDIAKNLAQNEEKIGRTCKMNGTVKLYRHEQGFGFIIPDDGQKDVFVHKTCLERHDMDHLIPGQRISMVFREVPKGREVVELAVIYDKN